MARHPSPKPRALTTEEATELQQLRKAYMAASANVAAAISTDGMSSPAFAAEEAKAAIIVRRIKEILGTTAQGSE
jgi:hypothetical protein